MKSIFLTSILFVSSLAVATEAGDTYAQVTEALCQGDKGHIAMNLETQELTGQFSANGRAMTLDFAPLKGEAPEYKVELIRDFLSSGYDLLGGVVVATKTSDGESFGTYAIVLDKNLTNPELQDMTVVYVEAMTGWQANMEMACSFTTASE